MQDIIYVAAGVSVLSCLSEYFNFLWLLVSVKNKAGDAEWSVCL